MNIERLKELINDETVDSFDYNINHNLSIGLNELIKAQWKIIYEALIND